MEIISYNKHSLLNALNEREILIPIITPLHIKEQ